MNELRQKIRDLLEDDYSSGAEKYWSKADEILSLFRDYCREKKPGALPNSIHSEVWESAINQYESNLLSGLETEEHGK